MKADYRNTAVVVPVYNSSEYLKELISRITKFFPKRNIFFINDGSTDDSAEICMKEKVIMINLPQNEGKGAALDVGFNVARDAGFDFAFSIDSDLQHKPEDFESFIKQQNRSEADVVIGAREFKLGKMPFMRIMSNTLTTAVVSLFTGKRVKDSQSGFRLYNLEKFAGVAFQTKRYQFETEILFKTAKRKGIFDFVKIDTIYTGQKSHISHLRDINNFIKIVLYEIFHR